jgi:Flp pilus assembly protein TadG
MCYSRLDNPKRSRSGATTVEFALTVPIILLLFLGSIEITRMNFLRHTAANAAYEAARASIVPGSTINDGIAEGNRLLQLSGASRDSTVTVIGTPDSVTANVTIPLNQNGWGLGRFSRNFNIVQNCVLRRELTQ